MPPRDRRIGRLGAAVLGTLVAIGLAAFAAPGHAVAAGAADAQASELVRLINGERAYYGLAALRVDPFLASKARDGTITCPSPSTATVQGRAKDMALHETAAHTLSACPSYTVLQVMPSWGYTGGRGEVWAYNKGYGTGALSYGFGCTNNQTSGCPGGTTMTYYTTGRAAANLMYSSQHRGIVLGGSDRIGCGAWISASGGYYYDCILSSGGPNATVAPPTTPPFADPPPTPRPTVTPPPAPPSATPRRTSSPIPAGATPGVPTPGPTAVASRAPGDAATPALTPSAAPMTGAPGESALAVVPTRASGDPPAAITSSAPGASPGSDLVLDGSRDRTAARSDVPFATAVVVAAAIAMAALGAAALGGSLVAVVLRRRRRAG